MVAAGIGAHVGLELYVLSEGRYHTQNFPDATVDFTKLAWDPQQSISTYSSLVETALAANGGRGWLTEAAGLADISGNFTVGVNPGLAFAYQVACFPITPTCNLSVDADAGNGQGGAQVMAMCATPAVCDDLSLATTGISGPLWVTRMRADLPASALATDLVLEAAPSQTPVPNLHTTEKYTDPNFNPCGDAGVTSPRASSAGQGSACAIQTKTTARARFADAIEFAFGGMLMAFALRRRRRP